MSDRKEIEINTAKEELKRINAKLTKPHLLIGGLAVQQYVSSRNSKDLDLVCDHKTVQQLIKDLYPSKNYDVIDLNEDEYRPSFEIVNKIKKNKMIFLGPKIWEREPYMGINWEELLIDAQPFSYRGEKLQNIKVPSIEMLAFTKMLSFISRVGKSPTKGENDLQDFIDLTNNKHFKTNALIDKIRSEKCEQIISQKIQEFDSFGELWEQSLLLDMVNILVPLAGKANKSTDTDELDEKRAEIHEVENSVAFYDLIADKYDDRNTREMFNTHKSVILLLNEKLRNVSSLKVLDIGSGTGRNIAFHYFGHSNIVWHCIEPSAQMRAKFEANLEKSKIVCRIFENSIYELPIELETETYDVIILSFVLSSLPNMPDFKELASLLNTKGIVVIADAAPSYAKLKPLYDFQLGKDKVTALAPRQVDPFDVAKELLQEDLLMKEVITIEKSNGSHYSYVLRFQR
ncbi:class I SAM-dependent methyltransferase [Pedobacter sp. N23S346]|uniref:class I SAM-dependent methyltransferase n=1 Tax=Pedobacter sp. N23S346 TaxID=3402750 RepID=UPI003AC8C201